MEATGRGARGSGTAGATVHTTLTDAGGKTRVNVVTDLNVTGRPAQFGRGVMSEVAAKLIDQFAKCLEDEINSAPSPAAATAPPAAPAAPVGDVAALAKTTTAKKTAAASSAPAKKTAAARKTPPPAAPAPAPVGEAPAAPPVRPPAEPIDLLEVAGGSVAKRLVPVVAAV